MTHIIFAMFSIVGPFLYQAQTRSSVHVHVTDRLGFEVTEYLYISLTRVGNPNSALQSTTGDFQQVPYGTYMLEVRVPGFIRFSRQIEVNQEHQWITAALEVSVEGGGGRGLDLVGELGPPQHTKEHISIKLVSSFTDVTREAPVRSDGTFKFPDLPVGTYVVITLRRGEVCDLRTHEVKYNSLKVNIVLSPVACVGN